MDESNRTPHNNPPRPNTPGEGSYTPYRRTVPHITQDPITDDGGSYADQRGAVPPRTAAARRADPRQTPGRKHMGVATSDPQYLQPVESRGDAPNRPAHPRHKTPGDGKPQALRSDRYLTTPSGRKSIFTARQDRARRRMRIILALALVIVIALVIWLLFLR